MNIMVVDDNFAMRKKIIGTLHQAGFGDNDVVQASDGAEALEAIRKKSPDLVLSDWDMPIMSGIELLKQLRDDGNQVTFGFITTEVTEPMRLKAREAGAKFLISKPFSVESFEQMLGTIMA